ncbi:MAG: hypothetical protein RLZZ352_613 [Pseudomonadota bacterium]|jgi:hypothetical protein
MLDSHVQYGKVDFNFFLCVVVAFCLHVFLLFTFSTLTLVENRTDQSGAEHVNMLLLDSSSRSVLSEIQSPVAARPSPAQSNATSAESYVAQSYTDRELFADSLSDAPVQDTEHAVEENMSFVQADLSKLFLQAEVDSLDILSYFSTDQLDLRPQLVAMPEALILELAQNGELDVQFYVAASGEVDFAQILDVSESIESPRVLKTFRSLGNLFSPGYLAGKSVATKVLIRFNVGDEGMIGNTVIESSGLRIYDAIELKGVE